MRFKCPQAKEYNHWWSSVMVVMAIFWTKFPQHLLKYILNYWYFWSISKARSNFEFFDEACKGNVITMYKLSKLNWNFLLSIFASSSNKGVYGWGLHTGVKLTKALQQSLRFSSFQWHYSVSTLPVIIMGTCINLCFGSAAGVPCWFLGSYL